jgi:hypothetical protein
MISSDKGIHVFVFCCAEYEDLIDQCLSSIKSYVVDPILSYNVVTNKTLNRKDVNIIKDFDFWLLLDPEFKYRDLYNLNWYRQQIFKLSVDQYVTGNILIVDAEVIFTGPTQWIHNGTVDIYDDPNFYGQSAKSFEETSKKFIKFLLNLDQLPISFVSESVIFSTEILKNIKKDIEFTHKKHWIKVLSEILIKNKSHNWDYTLSEYELYGNYLYKNHKNLIHEIKHKNPENFISRKVNVTSITGGKTKWLTFYQQVKGVDWPECENEEDFVNLPESIRKECIEIFNYEPKHHGGKPK